MESQLPILIIEDDPTIARALARAVQHAGREPVCISSWADSRPLVGPFAVAIVDLHLPDGNGLELFKELMRECVVDAAIFFSATTDLQEIANANALGCFIPKSAGVVRAVTEAISLVDEAFAPESETRPSTPRLPVVTSDESRPFVASKSK